MQRCQDVLNEQEREGLARQLNQAVTSDACISFFLRAFTSDCGRSCGMSCSEIHVADVHEYVTVCAFKSFVIVPVPEGVLHTFAF